MPKIYGTNETHCEFCSFCDNLVISMNEHDFYYSSVCETMLI